MSGCHDKLSLWRWKGTWVSDSLSSRSSLKGVLPRSRKYSRRLGKRNRVPQKHRYATFSVQSIFLRKGCLVKSCSLLMARYIRPGRVHPASRAWTVEETKIPHRPNSAISHRRESFPRNLIVNPAYKQPHYDPLDSAAEEDMVPTVMESPQNNTVPRRVTKRENINLVRQTEWDVKGTKTESLVQRNTLSKPVSVLLGLVCFTSCLSLILTLLILSGSIEAGRCSCGDNEGKLQQ